MLDSVETLIELCCHFLPVLWLGYSTLGNVVKSYGHADSTHGSFDVN